MTRRSGFPVDEIRGRLLHEKLMAEARACVSSQSWDGETIAAPDFPAPVETNTVTLREAVDAG